MSAIELMEPATQTSQVELRGDLCGSGQAQLPAVNQQRAPAAMAVTPGDLLRLAMERDDKDLDRLERRACL